MTRGQAVVLRNQRTSCAGTAGSCGPWWGRQLLPAVTKGSGGTNIPHSFLLTFRSPASAPTLIMASTVRSWKAKAYLIQKFSLPGKDESGFGEATRISQTELGEGYVRYPTTWTALTNQSSTSHNETSQDLSLTLVPPEGESLEKVCSCLQGNSHDCAHSCSALVTYRNCCGLSCGLDRAEPSSHQPQTVTIWLRHGGSKNG